MRVLVTGGAGFIGSNLVDALVARGDEVRVYDDLSTGYAENLNVKAQLFEGGVTDQDKVREAVDGCELVFHQAAHRAVFRSVQMPVETDRANTGGTLTVLAAAHDAGVRRVVSASSSSVYGGAAELPTPETAPLLPRSPYAVSKLAAEHYTRVYHELHGLETVSLRYFNVYGPRQRPDSQYAAVIPLFMAALRDGVSPEVHGDGLQSRDFTAITDVVKANLLAAAAPAEVCSGKAYNIAGGRSYSLMDILNTLKDLMGSDVQPTHVDPRPGDVRHSQADPGRAKSDLGFVAEVELNEGLKAALGWFEQTRAK